MFEHDVLEDRIYYYKNLFSDVDRVLDVLIKTKTDDNSEIMTPWVPWTSSDNQSDLYGETRTGEHQKRTVNSSEDFELLEVRDLINNIILECTNNYSKITGVEVGTSDLFRVAKYNSGKGMGSHIDNDYDENSENFEAPTISTVLYLNDNYNGGELYFREQNIAIKPKAGSLLIFPSKKPYFHEALAISGGEKYMCTNFFFLSKGQNVKR